MMYCYEKTLNHMKQAIENYRNTFNFDYLQNVVFLDDSVDERELIQIVNLSFLYWEEIKKVDAIWYNAYHPTALVVDGSTITIEMNNSLGMEYRLILANNTKASNMMRNRFGEHYQFAS